VSSRTKIGPNHIVLLAQVFRRLEGTWNVLHNGICYHNNDLYTLDNLSLLNKPIEAAFLVVHPRWRLGLSPQNGESNIKRGNAA